MSNERFDELTIEKIPELEEKRTYECIVPGQRKYYFEGENLLFKANRHGKKLLAWITIKEATHFRENGGISTRVLYQVEKIIK